MTAEIWTNVSENYHHIWIIENISLQQFVLKSLISYLAMSMYYVSFILASTIVWYLKRLMYIHKQVLLTGNDNGALSNGIPEPLYSYLIFLSNKKKRKIRFLFLWFTLNYFHHFLSTVFAKKNDMKIDEGGRKKMADIKCVRSTSYTHKIPWHSNSHLHFRSRRRHNYRARYFPLILVVGIL